MNQLFDDIELFVVISLTLLAKWLMTEEAVLEEETPEQRTARRKRTYGGMVAGVICGFYGPEILIYWSTIPDSLLAGVFSPEMIVPITIVMVISGEHIFRALITKLPSWIDLFVTKRISK